ncbi:MAG: hypothetical protein AB1768_10275 [Pseudomonadota bacterium]|jgi:hypothetical protein
MQPPLLVKYGFRIRTRAGLIVDNLKIAGRDAAEAERKLRQIYRDCEILERVCMQTGSRQVPYTGHEKVATLFAAGTAK